MIWAKSKPVLWRDPEQALTGLIELIQSDQDHDWLGPGVYFWEGDPLRAREWAEAKAARQPGMDPYVIGAVIDLGNCLDLTARADKHPGQAGNPAVEGRAAISYSDSVVRMTTTT